MYYKVRTSLTSRSVSNKEEQYSTFDHTNHDFKTIEEVKAHLKDTYRNCKKEKMYCDMKDGSTK